MRYAVGTSARVAASLLNIDACQETRRRRSSTNVRADSEGLSD
jgi:hypothetical protein